MATPTLQSIIEQIDRMTPDEQHKIVEHITQKRTITVYKINGEDMKPFFDTFDAVQQDTQDMSEEELDEFLSEVIAEVREENRAKRSN